MSFPFLSFIRVISRLTNSRSISPSADKFTPSSSTPTFLFCSLLSLTPPMFSPFIQGLHLHRWILDCLRIFSSSMNHQGCLLGSSLLHSLQGSHPARKDKTRGNCACSWSQVSPECLIKDIILQSCALQMFCFGGSLLFYSGAVGTAAVQIARALGAIVVGTAGTKDGMDVVTRFLSYIYIKYSIIFLPSLLYSSPNRCGAHHVFNHNHKSYEKKMVKSSTSIFSSCLFVIDSCLSFSSQVDHIGCFDVIIEHLANINLGHDVQMLKPQARWTTDPSLTVFGNQGGQVE